MMNIFKTIIVLFFLVTTINLASEKKPVVEILTNTFCPNCAQAHATMDSYLSSDNGDKIEYIYYHMVFPYPSDELNKHNKDDADAINNFYGPFFSTPSSFFNGTKAQNSYSNWKSSLDNLIQEESSFDINLSGEFTDSDFTIYADVTQSGTYSSDVAIKYIVVEDVNYSGKLRKNVMRKISNAEGDQFPIQQNETKNLSSTFSKHSEWNTEAIKVIVYIQDKSNKQILQSASISYSDLVITDINDEQVVRNDFNLEQNYPNPFNPTTTINYTVPSIADNNGSASLTQLTVFDILGKEVVTLVNHQQTPGNYKKVFDASNLSAGFYYYQLKVGNNVNTKKMILLK